MAEVGSNDCEYVEAGTIDIKDLPPLDATTNKIMKDELTTGFGLTVFYFILIFSIPIMNWFAPEFAFKKIWGGMTVTWFVTTVIMMAMAFIIAYVHTTLYEKRIKKYEVANK